MKKHSKKSKETKAKKMHGGKKHYKKPKTMTMNKGMKGGQTPELDAALKTLDDTTKNLDIDTKMATGEGMSGGGSDYALVNNSAGPDNSMYCPGKTWFNSPQHFEAFNKTLPANNINRPPGWERQVDGFVGAEPALPDQSSMPAPLEGGKKKRKSKKGKKGTKKSKGKKGTRKSKKGKKKSTLKKVKNSLKRTGHKVKKSAGKAKKSIKKFFSKLV